MKFHFLLLFYFVSLVNHSPAQINRKIPDWVVPVAVKASDRNTISKKDVTEGYCYLLIDEQHHTPSRQNYYHYAKYIVNEEALTSVSQIEFSYDPAYEKAFLHFIRIIRGNTVIDKTSGIQYKILNEENQRGIGLLTGRKTFYTNLTDIRKDDIVEFSFSIHGENPVMDNYFNYTFLLGYSDAIAQIYYRLVFPKETNLTVVNRNTSIKPVIHQGTNNDYIWQVYNPPTRKLEVSVPQWYNPYPSVQVSNMKSWKEVKSHYRSMFKLSAYDQSEMKLIVDSIVRHSSDPVIRISSVVDFVQKNIRYSGDEGGIYSNKPRSPHIILKNRFGDCKEKSVLLNELLKLLGIEAHAVLVNTIISDKTDEQAPGIGCFNHCISSFTYDGRLYFIDPTISYQTGNFKKRLLPPYGKGMILDDKAETFTIIPVDLSSQTTILEEFEITDSADTKLRVTSTFRGLDADETRYYFLTTSRTEIQEIYKKFYSRYSNNIEVIDTISYTDHSDSNEITTTEHYLLKNFWKVNDSLHSKKIMKDFLPYSLNSRLVYGDAPARKDPLCLSYPLNYTQIITIKHQTGWNIPSELKEENNEFFSYSYSKKVEGNTLKLLYHYRSHTGTVEVSSYENYRSKMDFVNRNMVMSIEETPFREEHRGFNWLLLLTIVLGITSSSILIWYLNRKSFKSNFENRYPSIGGWLILVGFGLLLTPLNYLVTIYNEWNDERDMNYFYYFFHEESDFFSPLKGYYTLFYNFLEVIMLVYAVFLVTIFFQKRNSFRLHFVVFKLVTMFFLIVHVVIAYLGYSDTGSSLEDRRELTRQTASLMGTFIATCIWVPYVWFSERSRHTFTHEHGDEDDEELHSSHQQL